MAVSTYLFELMIKNGSAYEQLVPIKDYPDMEGEREQLDATTTSDDAYVYIDGLQSNEAKEFTCNHDPQKYATIKGMRGTVKDFALYGGEDGQYGIWKWSGTVDVRLAGKGVNEVADMIVRVTPSTEVTFELPNP